MSVWVWLAVAVLGGVGAIARFTIDGQISARAPGAFPFGTLTINVTGAFVLGLFDGLGLTGDALLLAGTATLGAYTTFSTWMLETQRLAEDGDSRGAAGNVAVSVFAGFGVALAGRAIGVALR